MQYLGGKAKASKEITKTIATVIGEGPKNWWEPFCGGLSMSVQLTTRFGPGDVSDAHPALISLYQTCQTGWTPPIDLSRDEYEACKSLPDSDPLKAFVGFGCSFAGKYFAGYAANAKKSNYALFAKNSLARKMAVASSCSFFCASFDSVAPKPGFDFIYCDPPYDNTTAYRGFERFDSAAFWKRCQDWANVTRVFVSEYSCPGPNVCLWSKDQKTTVDKPFVATERLFEVLP